MLVLPKSDTTVQQNLGDQRVALLNTADLLSAFGVNISNSDFVDIAVAWIAPSVALDLLLDQVQNRKLKVRIIVGLSGNGTSPIALRSLQLNGIQIRIGKSPKGIFHPKLYSFRSSKWSKCWLGSSNFTLSGFSLNSELVHEFNDEGPCYSWFNELWNSLPPDSNALIDQYEKNWHRSRPELAPDIEPLPSNTDNFPELLTEANSWAAYLEALSKCDRYCRQRYSFSVLGDEWSYIDTIAYGTEIARRGDWKQLSLTEKRILLGIETSDADGTWGLLGNMHAAGLAVGTFYNSAAIRNDIRSALDPVISASNTKAFLTAVGPFIRHVSNIPGFGPAMATRLIALARPDCGISVNNGSAPGLSRLTGLSGEARTLGNPTNYPKLLNWIYNRGWYGVAKPQNAFEQTIWSMRAALIDAFVYEPT